MLKLNKIEEVCPHITSKLITIDVGLHTLGDVYENRAYSIQDSFHRTNSVGLYPIKDDLEYIPITSIFDRNNFIEHDMFIKNMLSVTKDVTRIRDLENLTSVFAEIVASFEDLYEALMKPLYDIKHDSMITYLGHGSSNISTLDIRNFLTSNRFGKYLRLYDLTIHPFYMYKGGEDKIIIFTLVVKKEHMRSFKENVLLRNSIDPRTVEIWIDKKYFQSGGRANISSLESWIKKYFPSILTFNSFVIREKDNILDELIYKPEIKFDDIKQVSEFKKNVNKILLST